MDELIEIEISHLLKQNHQLTISMDTATTTTQPITPPIIQPIIQPATLLQPVIIPTEPPINIGNTGFITPFVIKPELFNFFQHANLGPVDPRNPAAGPLRDHISFIGTVTRSSTYIANQSLITKLLAIYARVNNLAALSKHNLGRPESEWNRTWIGADQTMKTYLAKTLSLIRTRSLTPQRVQQRARTKARLEMRLENEQNERRRTRLIQQIADVKPFDPDDFRYPVFQTMIMLNKYGFTDPLPPDIYARIKDFYNIKFTIRPEGSNKVILVYSTLTTRPLVSITFGEEVKTWDSLMNKLTVELVKIYGTGESKVPLSFKMFFRISGEAKLAEEILKTYREMQRRERVLREREQQRAAPQ